MSDLKKLADWHEEDGAALWWRFPVDEAPYCGHPNCDDWPGYHTHWTRLCVPHAPDASVAAAQRVPETLYVECHECSNCGHAGLNDSGDGSSCNSCDWSGPSPKEDQCPSCDSIGTMCSACPECGSRYTLIASATLAAPPAPAAEPAETIKWPRGRDIRRRSDMGPDTLQITLDSDNDVCVGLWGEHGYAGVEFCNAFNGGGKSPRTREALINVMRAMEEDAGLHAADPPTDQARKGGE